MPKSCRKPSYLLHRPSGQARVRIDGKDHYLGPFDSPESHSRYDRLVEEWSRNHSVDRATMTVDELCIGYIAFAKTYYVKGGKPTSEVHAIRAALRPLIAIFGTSRAVEFGPLSLKRVRERMIAGGLARTTINKHADRIKRAFRWAVENELLPAGTYSALLAVRGLSKGRTTAAEPEPVKPVPDAWRLAVRPHVDRRVWAMIELQRLTGMRPGEVVLARPADLNTRGKAWEFTPESHKLEHRGTTRVVMIGPKGQRVLRPFLPTNTRAYCFSPRDAVAEQFERRRKPSKRRKQRMEAVAQKRPPRERYSVASYRRAISRACEKAGVPSWHPNQLRHSAATDLRRQYGIEAARAVLGHSDSQTTLIYAEQDLARAKEIACEVG